MRWLPAGGAMILIGLTGSIATGKSTVAELFKREGCHVIDADELTHRLYRKGSPVVDKLTETFSKEILDGDGNIDRNRLRTIVLNDREKLKILESIVHPEVEKLRNRMIEKIKKENRDAIVVYEVPLLFEKGLQGMFDYVVVVYAAKEQEIERLMKQRNIDRKEAERLLSLQIPIEEKVKMADFVIDNSGDLEDTHKQVKRLIRKLKEDPKKNR